MPLSNWRLDFAVKEVMIVTDRALKLLKMGLPSMEANQHAKTFSWIRAE